jgi:hypothetical protein
LLALVALVLMHGVVRIGPATPVCRVGVPCDKPAKRVALRFTSGTRSVMTTTDVFGRYRVSLPPGSWSVHASLGRSIRPARFFLPNVRTTVRNFAIDSGIR